MTKNHISLAAVESLLRESGVERVSDEAKYALRDYLEEHALSIGTSAWQFAQHAHRKTIKKKDIEAVVKKKEK